MTDQQAKYWWRAQSAAYVMRFTDETTQAIAALRHKQALHYMTGGAAIPFPLPPGTIAAHIRSGDKEKEMQLVPARNFTDAALRLIELMPNSFPRVFFVTGDDEAKIQEARRLIEGQRMTFVYTRLPRPAHGHDHNNWSKVDSRLAHEQAREHLLQLVMSLEADAWIGTRASNWNRLIDELRCVWVDKCGGVFVEVGELQSPVLYHW